MTETETVWKGARERAQHAANDHESDSTRVSCRKAFSLSYMGRALYLRSNNRHLTPFQVDFVFFLPQAAAPSPQTETQSKLYHKERE